MVDYRSIPVACCKIWNLLLVNRDLPSTRNMCRDSHLLVLAQVTISHSAIIIICPSISYIFWPQASWKTKQGGSWTARTHNSKYPFSSGHFFERESYWRVSKPQMFFRRGQTHSSLHSWFKKYGNPVYSSFSSLFFQSVVICGPPVHAIFLFYYLDGLVFNIFFQAN